MNGAGSSNANPSGVQGVCPDGWHVPSDAEWMELEISLGMSPTDDASTTWRGTDEGGKLKETGFAHWNRPNLGATNETGFTALPGGYRLANGAYWDLGIYAEFRTSTIHYMDSSLFNYTRGLSYDRQAIARMHYFDAGISVRCVRD